ncbi:hypothetical protein FANTH_7612 [Fusarium anthophilum]|uniref:NB-ARC domain-containing protein n=1 Tax=Fusarium anthophilum TaxID=48485 RepID=A0A8H4ZFL3_9HYPO|nr:hypothetical protein FANTH_7612 [Fusarium anthophilum]
MNGPTFQDPVYGSNVVTGITATGNAHQTFNFNQRAEAKPKAFYALPYEKNQDFVSRPDITSRLEELLPMNSDEFRSAALWGLGGSGKTQVALEYAYNRYRKSPCSVFWVHADNEATFAHDYSSIAKVLGLEGQGSGPELLQNVRHKIESLEKWLLVLDNADDLSLFGVGPTASNRTSKFTDLIPKGPNGTILWTSRDESIGGSLVGTRRSIPVSKMTFAESKALLDSTISRPTSQKEFRDVCSLMDELQHLPLAISQAGAYMRRTDTSVSQYLADLKEEQARWRVLKETEFDKHRSHGNSNSILETWSISIRRIRQENEMAYEILHILAYFDNQNIPNPLVEAAAEHGCDGNAEGTLESDRRKAVRRLKDFSFLVERRVDDGDERNFEMHKLVQDAARYGLRVTDMLETEEKEPTKESRRLRKWLKKWIQTPKKSTTKTIDQEKKTPTKGEKYFAGAASDIMLGLYPEETDMEKGTGLWVDCERYMAHAQRVCHWAEMFNKENSAVSIIWRYSRYLQHCGRAGEAVAPLTHLLDLTEKTSGEHSFWFIWGLYSLAVSFSYIGDYPPSIDCCDRALRLAAEGDEDNAYLEVACMSMLSECYKHQNRFDEAEKLALEAMKRGREHGCGDAAVFDSMQALAEVYIQQKRYDAAASILVQAVEDYRPTLGSFYPQMIPAYNHLGSIYTEQDKLTEAERAYKKALEFCHATYGEEHIDTIRVCDNLSVNWARQGRFEEALHKIDETCRLSEKMFGRNHEVSSKVRDTREWIEYMRDHQS